MFWMRKILKLTKIYKEKEVYLAKRIVNLNQPYWDGCQKFSFPPHVFFFTPLTHKKFQKIRSKFFSTVYFSKIYTKRKSENVFRIFLRARRVKRKRNFLRARGVKKKRGEWEEKLSWLCAWQIGQMAQIQRLQRK
jgi:hypothetical protein